MNGIRRNIILNISLVAYMYMYIVCRNIFWLSPQEILLYVYMQCCILVTYDLQNARC